MKKHALRILTLCLVFALCLPAGAETVADVRYTVAEKLVKQLEAGSGFTGTLTFAAVAAAGREAEAVTTLKPMVFDVNYIYVREDLAAKTPAENRFTLALKDGETVAGSAALAQRASALYLKSTLTGDGWYSLAGAADTDADAAAGALSQSVRGALAGTAMPGLAAFAAGLVTQLHAADSARLTTALEPYTTKIDLWIEGYRQGALLGKAEDGTTTMTVDYDIPAVAIKAQLKQLVMDMLADQALLPRLMAMLPAEAAERYLNPSLQNYYFYAIDQLPLTGAMAISRTVNLRGETLALAIALPLHDAQGGALQLRYERRKGAGDLPEENTVALTSDRLVLRADYQTYDTLTGTTVYQGTLLRQPLGAEAFEVDGSGTGSADAGKAISAAFTLSVQQTTATDANGQETQSATVALNLTPEYTPDVAGDTPTTPTEVQRERYIVFEPVDARLTAAFTSGQAKNAATSMEVGLTLSGDTLPQVYTLALSGKTRGKWTPEAFDAQAALTLNDMDTAALQSLLVQAGVRGGLLLLPYLSLPASAPDSGPTAAPTPNG